MPTVSSAKPRARGTAPGGAQLDRLFEYVGPCVILMDELVAYVRNAGEARDSVYTFVQALTESVRRSKNATLVVTLPESEVKRAARPVPRRLPGSIIC